MNNWIFISNFFNHHQKPFSDAMYKLLEGNYVFYALGEMDAERIKMGYDSIVVPNYVRRINLKSKSERSIFKNEVTNADVVIAEIGEARNFLQERLRLGKMTFVYSERLFKSPLRYLKIPIHIFRFYSLRKAFLLCCGAFSKGDYNMLGLFNGRCYKWGYFPEAYRYDNVEAVIDEKKKNSLLWAGRFLDWKHPELPILAMRRLVENGYDVHLEMIGLGVQEETLKALVEKEGVSDRVTFLGALPPSLVRKRMQESEIFLFTSDRGEGWGAVLNEAMNSCCAVVASDQIGSVPFLINDNVNGVIFQSGDVTDLVKKVEHILRDSDYRKKLAHQAYNTIINNWNAEFAARNLIRMVDASQCNKNTLVDIGPCSQL